MVDPATALLIASAIGTSAEVGGNIFSGRKAKKAGKMRAKEMKRETHAGLLQDALQRSAELQTHGLNSRSKTGKNRARSFQDTADLIRGAFEI
jgi:hypothetical protein